MKCCGWENCHHFCPWQLGLRARADHIQSHEDVPLFPDFTGAFVPKVKLVKSWMDTLDPELTGRSARRTGAMWYARQGMPIQEIAMLGRWKSSAVFRYVEEALQDIPLNSSVQHKVPHGDADQVGERQEFRKRKQAETETEIGSEGPNKTVEKVITKQVTTKVAPQVPDQVWVVSTARKSQMGHRVRQASWDMPLHRWATWCRWHFADRNVKVSMVTKLQQGISRCKKCESHRKARDVVNRGISLAQLLHLGANPHKKDAPEVQTPGDEDPTIRAK